MLKEKLYSREQILKFVGKKCQTKDTDFYKSLGFNINGAGDPAYHISGRFIPRTKMNRKNLQLVFVPEMDCEYVQVKDLEYNTIFSTWFAFLVFDEKRENKI